MRPDQMASVVIGLPVGDGFHTCRLEIEAFDLMSYP